MKPGVPRRSHSDAQVSKLKLLCVVLLKVTMMKGLNQEKWLSKRASRLQNSKIEVRGEAGVPDVHTLTLKLVTQAFLW